MKHIFKLFVINVLVITFVIYLYSIQEKQTTYKFTCKKQAKEIIETIEIDEIKGKTNV